MSFFPVQYIVKEKDRISNPLCLGTVKYEAGDKYEEKQIQNV